MSADEALFDLPGQAPPTADPLAGLSAGRRHTQRVRHAIAAGRHPLSLALGPRALHADASTNPDDTTSGPTCGTCIHRDPGRYAKCTYGGGARISHGVGTDVRAWWPACTTYDPMTTDPRKANP